MPVQEPTEPRRRLAAGMLLLSSWGFLGLGALEAPFLYFLGVVLPLGYLLAEQREEGRVVAWNGVWLQLFSGAAFYIGFAAHGVIGWLLF